MYIHVHVYAYIYEYKFTCIGTYYLTSHCITTRVVNMQNMVYYNIRQILGEMETLKFTTQSFMFLQVNDVITLK